MTSALAHDPSSSHPNGSVRVLRNEILFHAGEPRTTLYLIEAGIIAQYRKPTAQPAQVVEFAFAGDALGLGSLPNHVCSAQALGEARVRSIALSSLEALLRNDKRALHRYAEALEREFEFHRDELANVPRWPRNQVAALLLALATQNRYEGRDPYLVTDSLDCSTAAAWLGMEIDALAVALVELETLGLIQRCPPRGLRLTDLGALERLVTIEPASGCAAAA